MRLCAFVISILITVISTAQTPLTEELQLARKHFELKDFEKARIHLESIEAGSPLALDDVRRLALCYENLGDNEEAIYRWHEVIKSEDRTHSDLLNLAELFKQEARYDESLEILSEYRDAGGEMAQHFINSCQFAQQVVQSEANCDLENMSLNTSSAESGISFYNGDLVYATHRVDLSARFGIKGDMDKRPKSVLLSTKENDPTSSNPLKVQDREGDSFGFVSYAANGRLMVYVKSDFKADASGVQDAHDGMALFYAISEGDAWTEDKAFPFNSTEYDNGFPFVSEDGTTLFYSSDMPGGSGGFDLYVSHFENGAWTNPENLGPQVNTPGNEITPFLTEGKLYFASDWLPGLGGYDVYSIKNVEDEWGQLSHLGACVNSPSDDFGFVMNPTKKSAYFTSSRKGGKGHDDIYKIRDRSTISEIELVSTETIEVPRITSDIEDKEEEIKYPTESELKEANVRHIIIEDASDVAQVEEELVKLRKLMHHKLDTDVPRVRSNDLPDLNFDVDYIDQAEEVDEVETIATQVEESDQEFNMTEIEEDVPVDLVSEELKKPVIIQETMRLPKDKDWTVKGLNIESNEIVLSAEDVVKVERPMIEDDFSDYLIFDDPYINKLVLAPQEKVYFIQIAALKNYTSNMDRFAHFSRYGNVYKVSTGGMLKIRIGYFKTQREAISVLDDLKRRGIREAFIIGDILDVERMELIASPLDAEEGEVVNLSNDDLVPSYISKYKVRVSSYQWPSQFQTSQIADLGHIEHWTKGPWKIILLSGYSTRAQAFEVQRKCQERGFNDAYVVKDQNGTLQRIDQ